MEQAWRRSAALILALGKTCEELPTFVMVQRSAGSSFMPGSHVFPGGMCSEADFSSDWLPIFGSRTRHFLALPSSEGGSDAPATNAAAAAAFDGVDPGGEVGPGRAAELRAAGPSRLPSAVGLRITAIRETFEETGCLLASADDDANEATWRGRLAEAGRFRERVRADAREFISMCREQRLCPDLARLHQWSRWLTPLGHKSGRRYDTTFYVAVPPPTAMATTDAAAVLQPDAGEVTSIKVDSAESILRGYVKRHFAVAPPQLYELARLQTFGSLLELEQTSAWREPLGLELWAPVAVVARDGTLLVLPGDDLYPAAGKDGGPLGLDLTVDEAMKQHPRHNRAIACKGQLFRLSVNVPLRLGQRAPLPALLQFQRL